MLFIPSVERDGKTQVMQDVWSQEALTLLGSIFGGATSLHARGVWRDDDNQKNLVWDDPIVVWSFVAPEALENDDVLDELHRFCRRMGRETKQGEVGLLIDFEYYAITKFTEE